MKADLRSGSGLIIASGVGQALDLAATFLVIRALGLETFGVLVAARAVTGLVDAFFGFRSWEGVLAFAPRFERDGRIRDAQAIVSLALVTEGVVGVIGAVGVTAAASILPGSFAAAAGGILLLPLVYTRHAAENLIQVHHAAFRLRGDYLASALQTLIAPIVRLTLFGLLLVGESHSLLAFALADGGVAVGAWLIGFVVALMSGRLVLSGAMLSMMRSDGRNLLRFFVHSWLAGAVKGITAYGAETILGAVSSFSAVGAFGVARRLAGVLSFLLSPFLYVVTPWVYRAAAAGDVVAMRRLLARITLWSLPPIVFVDAVLIGWGGRLLRLLAGGEVPSASYALVLLAAAFSLQFAFSWARPAALGMQMSGLVVVSQALSGTALIVCTLTLAPPWGATGAAIAVLTAYVMDVVTTSVVVLRRLGQDASITGSDSLLEPSAVGR